MPENLARSLRSCYAKEQVILKAEAGDIADILENRRALGAESQSHIGLTFFFLRIRDESSPS